MSIRFRCYACLKKISCPEAGMGLFLSCPHCGATVRVPIPADLGAFTVEQIKANQKAQVRRAKRKQRGGDAAESKPSPVKPVARPAAPVRPVADSASGSGSDSDPGSGLDELPVARIREPAKAHPVPEEPDVLEIEMAGGDDGPNETDDLLASLARVAGDGDSEDDADLAMEQAAASAMADDTESDGGDAADMLAQLAAAAEEESEADASDKDSNRRGGRRR